MAAVPRVVRYGNTRLLRVNVGSFRQRGPLVAFEFREDHRSRLVALQRGIPVPACVVSMWTKGKRLPRLSSAMRSVGRRRALVFSYCPATERHAVIRLHRVSIDGYVDDSRCPRAGGAQEAAQRTHGLPLLCVCSSIDVIGLPTPPQMLNATFADE